MNLLDTSPDRVRASEIQCLQMGAEQLAAYALKHELTIDMKVEPGQPPAIAVKEGRNAGSL